MTTGEAFETIVRVLRENGYSDTVILDRLVEMFRGFNLETVDKDEKVNIESRTKAILAKLGVPKSLKGYRYILYAVKLYAGNPNMRITKELYPEVAKKFQTTPSRVERAIRHAIDRGLSKGEPETIFKIFGRVETEMTNSEFIAEISDKVK